MKYKVHLIPKDDTIEVEAENENEAEEKAQEAFILEFEDVEINQS